MSTAVQQLDELETSADSLPEGWAVCQVHEVFTSYGGGTPNRATSAYWGGTIPWLSSGDIKTDRIQTASECITKAGLENSSANLCRPGAVVVVVRSGILAHTLPVAILEQAATINQDIKCFDSSNDDLNGWLALALQSSTKKILTLNREGTTVQSVKYDTLRMFELWAPPLPEQRRIVAKVEELLAHVNASREHLAKVPKILKAFRQSVLAAACSGRLTEDWRETYPNAEPARIAAEAIEDGMEDDLPEIPDSWRWVPIRLVAEVQGGIQKQPKRAPKTNAYPYLRVANVLRDRLDLSEILRMELFKGELEKYRLEPEDLLIVEGNGSIKEIGRSAVWSGQILDCVHQNHIIRVRARACLARFLNVYWNSPVGIDRVMESAVTTAGLFSISTKKVANLPAPLPSLEEQHEIVRRVDALFKLAEAIERRVAAAAKRAEKLTQSILGKAFRGELVPTEAELARREGRSYEPASALLDRIKKERESKPQATKPKRLATRPRACRAEEAR